MTHSSARQRGAQIGFRPRAVGLALVMTILGALLAGCNTGRSVPGTTRVSFMVFGDPAELAAYRKLVAAFEAKQSEVRIQLIHIPSQKEYRRRLAADFTGGAPADVLLSNYLRFSDLASRGGVEILTPYFVRSTVLREEEFNPLVLKAFTWRNRLYGIPQNVSSLVVYYNKALFDAAGLPYPEDDWNWNDFVRTARALTRDVDSDGRTDQYGLGVEPTLTRLAPFIWQNGGELVDNRLEPTRLRLLEAPAVEAAQWFVDLQVRHGVVPNRVEERAEESEARFLNGRTAMFLNSRRGVPTYREIRGFDWDVAPLPRAKERAGILHSDAYFIARSSRVKDAAWRFIEYACSREGQEIIAASGRTVPSNMTVAASAAFLDPERKPQNSRVFLDTVPVMRAAPQHAGWVDIEEIASDELERAFYGEVELAEALRRTVERTQNVFNEYGPGAVSVAVPPAPGH